MIFFFLAGTYFCGSLEKSQKLNHGMIPIEQVPAYARGRRISELVIISLFNWVLVWGLPSAEAMLSIQRSAVMCICSMICPTNRLKTLTDYIQRCCKLFCDVVKRWTSCVYGVRFCLFHSISPLSGAIPHQPQSNRGLRSPLFEVDWWVDLLITFNTT